MNAPIWAIEIWAVGPGRPCHNSLGKKLKITGNESVASAELMVAEWLRSYGFTSRPLRILSANPSPNSLPGRESTGPAVPAKPPPRPLYRLERWVTPVRRHR
jgi:hypothetical protein